MKVGIADFYKLTYIFLEKFSRDIAIIGKYTVLGRKLWMTLSEGSDRIKISKSELIGILNS
jgi:hypothetical protein